VADQFLERLVRHLHIKRRTGIDETGDHAIHLSDDKTFRPSGNARGDLLASGRLVALVGNGFDGVAAVQVGGGDVTNDGVHGSSEISRRKCRKHKGIRPAYRCARAA
jgi:hypothetical protein